MEIGVIKQHVRFHIHSEYRNHNSVNHTHEINTERKKMIYIMKDIKSGMKISKVMKKYSITATLVLAILQIQIDPNQPNGWV